jgi:hypothetical protein
MAEESQITWTEITTQFSGRTVTGSYSLDGGVVEVRTAHGAKATQLGGSPVEVMARRLLRELAAEVKA